MDAKPRLNQEVDESVKPGDDFFRYVNNKWMINHPLPPNKASVSAFSELNDNNLERLRKLLRKEIKPGEPTNLKLVRQFYHSGMDETAIADGGLVAIQDDLTRIDKLADRQQIVDFITGWHGRGLGLLWHLGIGVDDKNSQRFAVIFDQGGLGLPDRDYYLEDSEQFIKIRSQYKRFLSKLFALLGEPESGKSADKVYAIELELAKASASTTDRRDPDKMYNRLAIQDLGKNIQTVDWKGYFDKVGLGGTNSVVVSHPPFLAAAGKLLSSQPLASWQAYLKFHSVVGFMTKLPKPFEDLWFDFYGRVINGVTELEPRYRRIIARCQDDLLEPIGQLFVENYFDESAKLAISDLVEHLRTAFRQRIEALPWMGSGTKAKALEKLETFVALLGYPDRWRDYNQLHLGKNYLANYLAVREFDWRRDTGRINKPVDRHEWIMSPATVNACYWANTNSLTFPAAILLPPFFDARGDFAANYGAIGVVIGHEMTHGFDDEGSKFDKVGNLSQWWTDDDRRKFEACTKPLEEQFGNYKIDGRAVNGKLTLGENIADLGGVMIAYDALQRKLDETGNRQAINGFSPEQRFFMAYARIWRENIRPERSLSDLVSNPHAPNELRVNGVATNCSSFYDAFGVKPGDKLYRDPDLRVGIW